MLCNNRVLSNQTDYPTGELHAFNDLFCLHSQASMYSEVCWLIVGMHLFNPLLIADESMGANKHILSPFPKAKLVVKQPEANSCRKLTGTLGWAAD